MGTDIVSARDKGVGPSGRLDPDDQVVVRGPEGESRTMTATDFLSAGFNSSLSPKQRLDMILENGPSTGRKWFPGGVADDLRRYVDEQESQWRGNRTGLGLRFDGIEPYVEPANPRDPASGMVYGVRIMFSFGGPKSSPPPAPDAPPRP